MVLDEKNEEWKKEDEAKISKFIISFWAPASRVFKLSIGPAKDSFENYWDGMREGRG